MSEHNDRIESAAVEPTSRWWSILPSLLVGLPLTGYSLQSDEKRSIYEASAKFGVNPWDALVQSIEETPQFSAKATFDPSEGSLST
jgi:hypothetical protein